MIHAMFALSILMQGATVAFKAFTDLAKARNKADELQIAWSSQDDLDKLNTAIEEKLKAEAALPAKVGITGSLSKARQQGFGPWRSSTDGQVMAQITYTGLAKSGKGTYVMSITETETGRVHNMTWESCISAMEKNGVLNDYWVDQDGDNGYWNPEEFLLTITMEGNNRIIDITS